MNTEDTATSEIQGENELNENQNQDAPGDELTVLKARAKLLGIEFSNNIRVDTLRARIQAKLDETETPADEDEDEQEDEAPVNALATGAKPEPVKPKTLMQHMQDEQMKLVRCRIMNMDPKKKDLPGEIITVANEYLGTVKKFVPFGEATEDGYHIPQIIYQYLKDKRFLNIRVVKVKGTSQTRTESNWIPEFNVEVLDPLSEDELKRLATAQIAAGSLAE